MTTRHLHAVDPSSDPQTEAAMSYERKFSRVLDAIHTYIEDTHDKAEARRSLHRMLSRRPRRSEDAAYIRTALDSIEEVRK